jgi:pilus assembly protein FimV
MKVHRRSTAWAVGVLLMGMGMPAWSLGFGRPVSRAILGETFSVTVPVRLESAETLDDDCLAADVFFGDDKLPSSVIKTTLLPGQGAERTVRVSTTALINEPVVTLYVVAGCKAKVTRKFVAFADPPMVAPATMAQGAAPVAVGGTALPGKDASTPVSDGAVSSGVSSASALKPTPLEGGRGKGSRAARASNRDGVAASVAASNGPVSSALMAKPSNAHASLSEPKSRKKAREAMSARIDNAEPKESSSRLVLDPVEADAVVAPNLSMSGQMVSVPADLDSPEARDRRAAAAALWAAMSASPEQLARDRIRMQELEQRLAKLQQDAASAREKVVSMEARVREAEDARLSNPIVMGLAGACVLLAGGLGFVLWRQRQREAAGTWWQPDAEPDTSLDEAHSLAERSLERTSAEFVAVLPAAAQGAAPAVDAAPVHQPAQAMLPEPAASGVVPTVPSLPTAPPAAAPLPSAQTVRTSLIKSEEQDAAREITVEELIDLEQQAEFFVVLGQDDAAVELLESHVQNTAGASPLPYLKLLEIYQRLGRKTQYQQVQGDFNSRFNAYAPSWEADLQQGHALEEYPGVIERLQALWSPPSQAMDVLQKSLTRPDESVETFDLPAYRELLFLYAVARDLSERESAERQPVDLMGQAAHQLMGGSSEAAAEAAQASHEPLMATRPVKAATDVRLPSLSLDLSLDDPASGHGALVDNGPLDIDLPEIDLTAVEAAGAKRAADRANDIEFEHIDIDTPNKP